jgi:Delta7-sterol 5-desaturase
MAEAFLREYFWAFTLNSLRYFSIAGLFFIPFYIAMRNHFAKNKIQEKDATRNDFYREIKDSITTMFIFGLTGSLIISTPIKNYSLMYDNPLEYGWVYLIASIGIALIIHDAYFYWTHKWMHGKRIYNQVHKTHHLSVNPSPWASYTFGVIEGFMQSAIVLLLAFVLPMHLYALLTFTLVVFVINVYGHLGFEIAPLWLRKTPIFKWMATSTYHNMHHSEFNGNYGLYLRFWDKLMKTELPGYEKLYDTIQEKRIKGSIKSEESESELEQAL